VQWSRRTARDALKSVLADLPAGFRAAPVGVSWFLAGPTGTFLVAAEEDLDDPVQVGRLATQVRTVLAQHLTWVPFVHALLVSDKNVTVHKATVVPTDMVRVALTDGRVTIEAATLEKIDEVIERRILERLADPVVPGARIGECTSTLPLSP